MKHFYFDEYTLANIGLVLALLALIVSVTVYMLK